MDAKEVVDAAIALMNATTLTPELYRDLRSRSKEINIKGEAYSSVWPQTFQRLIALAKFDDAVTVCMWMCCTGKDTSCSNNTRWTDQPIERMSWSLQISLDKDK